jgi:hypothetical protein
MPHRPVGPHVGFLNKVVDSRNLDLRSTHRMMMALLPAKRDGSLFDVALHRWKQPLENMFVVQAPKLWSPEPV